MGALSIRLPESLHDHVRSLSEEEGISMNQFVVLAVAEKVTRLDANAQFACLEALQSLGRQLAAEEDLSLKEAARQVLDKAGDETPREGDEIPAPESHR